jgi:hypothetical protein
VWVTCVSNVHKRCYGKRRDWVVAELSDTRKLTYYRLARFLVSGARRMLS